MSADNEKTLGLLEYIAANAGCQYLSDLSYPCRPPLYSIARIVRKIDPAQYSLREWADAVHYITGQEREFASAEQAARYLSEEVFQADFIE